VHDPAIAALSGRRFVDRNGFSRRFCRRLTKRWSHGQQTQSNDATRGIPVNAHRSSQPRTIYRHVDINANAVVTIIIFIKEVGHDQERDRLVFSTDYPHGDSKYPHAVNSFLDLTITDEDKRKILWDNCAGFYKVT